MRDSLCTAVSLSLLPARLGTVVDSLLSHRTSARTELVFLMSFVWKSTIHPVFSFIFLQISLFLRESLEHKIKVSIHLKGVKTKMAVLSINIPWMNQIILQSIWHFNIFRPKQPSYQCSLSSLSSRSLDYSPHSFSGCRLWNFDYLSNLDQKTIDESLEVVTLVPLAASVRFAYDKFYGREERYEIRN